MSAMSEAFRALTQAAADNDATSLLLRRAAVDIATLKEEKAAQLMVSLKAIKRADDLEAYIATLRAYAEEATNHEFPLERRQLAASVLAAKIVGTP